MWKLVGMTIFLCRSLMANINDENPYYLTVTDVDRSLESLENSRGTTLELGTSETTRLGDDDNYQQQEQQQQTENGSLGDYSTLKSQLKRSIVHVDLRDGTSELRQAPAPLATLLYWPDREDQVIGMENRRNPLIQERRNPSFSPWGGKRDMDRYKTIKKTRRPARVPFNSWGGKRNDPTVRFSPAADLKRDELMNGEGKKSPPFHSWGGKRATSKFRPFYSAKHSYDPEDRRISRESEQRVKINNDFGSFTSLENSGRGKRSEKFINNETTEIKRGTVKFIGSGEMTTSGSSTLANNFPRAPFEPWGGKRKGDELRFSDDDDDDDDQRLARFSLILRKIGRLIPWTE